MSNDEDLFSLYFRLREQTESPVIYHRWSLIAALGAFLGRQYYFPFGDGKLYPNQYVMLIGNPGTRKSSAIKGVKKVLGAAGYDKFSAERTTKEKFLLDLEGKEDENTGPGGKTNGRTNLSAQDILGNLGLDDGAGDHDGIPREVFITADEFNEFAGTGNLDFLSTLGALWDWDDESNTYRQRFKNSKSISIYQPTISILGGNTHQSFQAAFPAAAIGQGFLSRLILVHSEPSGRKITFPPAPDERLIVELGERFNAIKTKVRGPATRSASASEALDTINRTWRDIDDYRLKSYSTRRFTHLLKLCLITSAARVTTRIDVQDVLLANTILTFTENSMSKALGEYGKQRNSEATQAVMSALYEARNPLKFEDLWKIVSRDLEKRDQLTDVLQSLSSAGKIQHIAEAGGFIAKQKPVSTKALYVQLNMLKEYN